jgi:type I restriction enzyme R subunit
MAFLTEADTCRKYVLPKLYAAGWTDDQISEQKSFTDGRIVVAGTKVKRRPQKRLDYLLRYRRDFPIAVVEAKTVYANPGDGLQLSTRRSSASSSPTRPMATALLSTIS